MFVKGAALLCSLMLSIGICSSPHPAGRDSEAVPPHPLPTAPFPGSLVRKVVCLLLSEAKQDPQGWLGDWDGGQVSWRSQAGFKDEDNSPRGS